jgi:hypothetical protein
MRPVTLMWAVANGIVLLYLAQSRLRVQSRRADVDALVRSAAAAAAAGDGGDGSRLHGGAPGGVGAIAAGSAAGSGGWALPPIPGAATTDYGTAGGASSSNAGSSSSSSSCGPAGGPHADVWTATHVMKAACPTRYANTTLCQDLGPSCVQGDDVVLYDPGLQPSPGDGWYRRLVPDVYRKLDGVMFWVAWGGSNADGWNGNLLRFENARGFTKAWPAGAGAAPPVPFSDCNTPLLLYWDFPENYYHTLASYATLWAAVRSGALSENLTVALGLPFPYLSAGASGGALPEYLTVPLRVMFKRGVVPLAHLAAHGQEDDAGGVTTAPVLPVGDTGALTEAGAPPPPPPGVVTTTAERAAQRAAQSAWGGRLGLPPVRCFARTPVCSVAGYSERPPAHFYEFMQAVKDELLGRARNYDANSPAIVPHAWPTGARYVTGPGGVLRVTLAMRKEGTRRVLNADELLAACKEAAVLRVPRTPGGGDGGAAATDEVPISCELWSFGQGGGMKGDVWKMHNTDVLVAVHGAGLTNLGFLRPGAIVVELRPGGFKAANADRFYRPLAVHSGALKFWCLRLHGGLQSPGPMEAAAEGNPEKYERDRDLLVPWETLADTLATLAGTPYDAWRAVADVSGGDSQRGVGPFTDVSS